MSKIEKSIFFCYNEPMKKVKGWQAIPVLKEKERLVSIVDRTIVYMDADKIRTLNENWHSVLNEEEFLELFSNTEFVIYDKDEDGIDESKDIAYYQWRETYQ